MSDTLLGALIGVGAVIVSSLLSTVTVAWRARRKSRRDAVARVVELFFDNELTTSDDFANLLAINRWDGQVMAASVHCPKLFAAIARKAAGTVRSNMGLGDVKTARRVRAAAMVTVAATLELQSHLTQKRLMKALNSSPKDTPE
jgi:hypothetical protein